MKWILYAMLGSTYLLTLAVRAERAQWMSRPTILELTALYFVPTSLVALLFFGLRRTTNTGEKGFIAIALLLSLGVLMLALLPGVQ
jgi:hypothetical protein